MQTFKAIALVGVFREEELNMEFYHRKVSSETYIDSTEFSLVEDELQEALVSDETINLNSQIGDEDYKYYLVEFTGSLDYHQDYWGEWDVDIVVDIQTCKEVANEHVELPSPGPEMPDYESKNEGNMEHDLGNLSLSFLKKIVPFFSENGHKENISGKLLSGFKSELNEDSISELNKFLIEYYPELTFDQGQKILNKIEVQDGYSITELFNMKDDEHYPEKEFKTLSIQDLYDTLIEVGQENNEIAYSVTDFIKEYQDVKTKKMNL